METVNPFNDDEFKKKILSQQQGSSNKKVDPSDYEIIEPEDTVADDMRSIISQAPKIPLSNNAKNIIVDASALAKNAKEQKDRL
jgi:hypothetical protein